MKTFFDSITDIVFVNDKLIPSDIIMIAGGSRRQLAEKAAELYHGGLGKQILVSGGPNKKLENYKTECDFLCEKLIELGVPEVALIREDAAANTAENAIFTDRIIKDRGLAIKTALLVCKTYHSRRCKLTYQIYTSGNINYVVAPIIDERNITKDNWFENSNNVDLVLTEVEKIGKYFKEELKKDKHKVVV